MKKILFAVSLVFLFSGCSSSPKQEATTAPTKKILDTSTFETSIQDFQQEYKKALFTTGQAKANEAKNATEKALIFWQGIETEYSAFQPTGYLSTHDWKDQLSFIGKLMKDANTFAQNEQFIESRESLDGVRKTLFAIRKANGIESLSDTMLVFQNTMEEALAKPQKDPSLIEKLQEEIKPIVEKQGVPAYQDASRKLGKMVNELSQKEGKEYSDELRKIKQVFENLYLLFG